MAMLANPRHEAFARGLFEGKSQEQAYIDAGYSAGDARSKASRLLATNGNISARVAEYSTKAESVAVWSKADAMNKLAKLHDKFAKNDDPASGSVARASVMDYAKLSGWVVDKAENRNTVIPARELNEDELDARIAAGLAALERPAGKEVTH